MSQQQVDQNIAADQSLNDLKQNLQETNTHEEPANGSVKRKKRLRRHADKLLEQQNEPAAANDDDGRKDNQTGSQVNENKDQNEILGQTSNKRQFKRKIRTLKDLNYNEDSDDKLNASGDQGQRQQGSDDEFQDPENQRQGNKKASSLKWNNTVDEADFDEEKLRKQAQKKQKNQKKENGQTRKKKATESTANSNPNLIKANNRLVGQVEFTDLYHDDSGVENDNYNHSDPDDINAQDLEIETKLADKKQLGSFLSRIDSKNQNQSTNEVTNLGFMKKISNQLSKDELAASGIHLSLRETLNLNKKQEDLKSTNNDVKASKTSQDGDMIDDDEPEQIDTTVKQTNQQQNTQIKGNADESMHANNDQDDDDEGLEFVCPKQERQKQLLQKLEEEKEKKPKMVKVNGKMISAENLNFLKNDQKAGNVGAQNNCGRSAMFASLKSRVNNKRSINFDLNQLKSTFCTTDLNQASEKKNTGIKDRSGDQIDELDDSDESDYDPDQKEDCQVQKEEQLRVDWDEEENDAQDEQQQEEAEEESANSQEIDNTEDMIDNIALTSNDISKSQASHASNVNSVDQEEQMRIRQMLRMQEIKKLKAKQKLAKFLDDEADLGSDNEENDDVRKVINRNAEDENDNIEGLDDDLDGFVVHAPDNQQIDSMEDAHMQALINQQRKDDDKALTKEIIAGAVFGQNKKRKRGDIEGLDELESSKRKMRRIEERVKMFADMESDDEENLNTKMTRNLQAQKIREMNDNEEMSESEVQKQLEQIEFKRFQRQRQIQQAQQSNASKEIQKRDQDLEDLMIDINQKAKCKKKDAVVANNGNAFKQFSLTQKSIRIGKKQVAAQGQSTADKSLLTKTTNSSVGSSLLTGRPQAQRQATQN